MENARINLGYTNIVSPVTGRAGMHLVDIGNIVQAGQTNGIVVVTQLQPMSVLFTIPEDSIGQVMARNTSGAVLPADAYDRSQTNKIASGTLSAVDTVVDPTTGSVKLRALFDNQDGKLFPNQFVNVRLLVDTLHNQTVIPVAAIQRGADGAYVFVVTPEKTVAQRTVKTGVQDGNNIQILSGIKPGDTVVVDGADRLRDGADVEIPNPTSKITAPSGSGADDAARAARRAQAAAALNKACSEDIKKLCPAPQAGASATELARANAHVPVPEPRLAQRRLLQGPVAMRRGQGGGGGRRGGGGGGAVTLTPSERTAGDDAPHAGANISAPFIQRPVATSLLMIAILLVGLSGYKFLPLSALPEVDYPTIQVQTFLPGASPDVMTTSVTAPLEKQFGQMPGLKEMSSVSSAGSSVITLQFDLSLTLDIAEQEVQAAINASNSLLAQQLLPAPPVYAKVNPADAPVITLAVSSTSLPITTVEELADTRIAQKISQLYGVGLVSISGGQRPAVRVQANLQKLAALGLNIDDLRTTIANNNSNAPKGSFDGAAQSYTINANDQLQDRRGLQEHRRRLQERRAGLPARRRQRGAGRREQQAVELGQQAPPPS